VAAMYELGDGATKNDAEAVAWYRKAADQGDVYAMNGLGVHLFQGTGVARNEAEAMQWFRKAADKGFAPAQIHLAILYENGWGGVNQDLQKARELLLQAANSPVPEVASQAKEMAANISSPSPGPSPRAQVGTSDTSAKWKVAAVIGGGLLLAYLLSGHNSHDSASAPPSVNSSSGGSGYGGTGNVSSPGFGETSSTKSTPAPHKPTPYYPNNPTKSVNGDLTDPKLFWK
jgi:hypothetical protein